MFVKILKANKSSYWYFKNIGETVEIFDYFFTRNNKNIEEIKIGDIKYEQVIQYKFCVKDKNIKHFYDYDDLDIEKQLRVIKLKKLLNASS